MFIRVILPIMLFASPAALAERQVTRGPGGHLLHNRQCFSPDGRYLYYDARNDDTKLGESRSIGRVEIASGHEETLYRSVNAGVGAVSCHPREQRLAFIHGLANVSATEPYAPQRRYAASLAADGTLIHLDARDTHPPFTPGSLRGGTHAFHWSPQGTMLSFTYNDALIPQLQAPEDRRTIGVMLCGRPVEVRAADGSSDFSGTCTAAIVVPVTANPIAGNDGILRAFDEDWLDEHSLVFQGIVVSAQGEKLTELFRADLPSDFMAAVPEKREAAEEFPHALSGASIRRLTHTEDAKYPGIQGPRHWVRVSPDRKSIAFLAKDERGVVQIHAVPPQGGNPVAVSRLPDSVEGCFDWSPDGRHLACSAGGRVQWIDAATGAAQALSDPGVAKGSAVVVSPRGERVYFNRLAAQPDGAKSLQIIEVKTPAP